MPKPTTAKKVHVLRILLPVYACFIVLFAVLIRRGTMQLLLPAGTIADIQSRILWGALAFAAVVGSSIIITFFVVAFRYRDGAQARYTPEWTAGKKLQLAGWLIPLVGISAIAVMVWDTAHMVDPYRPLSSTTTPVTVQVVALQWKWLFLYPQDHIATVNMLEIPAGTPINLQLTADAPMNSFWVPRLSGQVYAMTGMVTQLHIQADRPGSYPGSSAEISGAGFAGMAFMVKAVPARDYTAWKATARRSPQSLNYAAYASLAKPSSYNAPATYALADPNLFQAVIMQFMVPGADPSTLTIRGIPS